MSPERSRLELEKRRTEALQAARTFVRQHGRVPRTPDFPIGNGSITIRAARHAFGSLDGLHRALNAPTSHERRWTTEKALTAGRTFLVEHPTLTQRDLGSHNGLPSLSTVEKLFESLPNYQFQLMGRYNARSWTYDEAFAACVAWQLAHLGRLFRRDDLAAKNGLPSDKSVRDLTSERGGLSRFMLDVEAAIPADAWTAQCSRMLWAWCRREMRLPKIREMIIDPRLPHPRHAERYLAPLQDYFGEIADALADGSLWGREDALASTRAWVSAEGRLPLPADLRSDHRLYPLSVIEALYGSVDNLHRALGHHPEGGELFTAADCLDAAHSYLDVHGRLPRRSDWDDEAGAVGKPLPYLDEVVEHYGDHRTFLREVESSRSAMRQRVVGLTLA